MASISVQRDPVFTVSMRLSETETLDLLQSICEATQHVHHWRSDPRVLNNFAENLRLALDARR